MAARKGTFRPPPGFSVSKYGHEARRLVTRIESLCFDNRVNEVASLPPAAFAEAVELQARIAALLAADRARLKRQVVKIVPLMRAGMARKKAAEREHLKRLLAQVGNDMRLLNRAGVARSLGITKHSLNGLLRSIVAELANEPAQRCPSCGHIINEPTSDTPREEQP